MNIDKYKTEHNYIPCNKKKVLAWSLDFKFMVRSFYLNYYISNFIKFLVVCF